MKKDTVYNIIIGFFIIAITILVVVKFFLKGDKTSFVIEDLNDVEISDFSGKKFNLISLLNKNEETYFLMLEVDNCGSCISKGLSELKSLQKVGKTCIPIVIHDRVNEISGWASNYDFSSFFCISKKTYYEYFKFTYLPVIFSIKNKTVKIIRYITF